MKDKPKFFITQTDFANEINCHRTTVERVALSLRIKIKKICHKGKSQRWYTYQDYCNIKQELLRRGRILEAKKEKEKFPDVIYVTRTYEIYPSKMNYIKNL